jgi:hypothetical protein
MSRFTKKAKLAVAVTAIAAVGLGTGLAAAYWSSTGTGSGSATTGTSTSFTIASSAATGGALTPGGPVDSVAFTVTNPSTGNQALTSVVVTVANSNGSAWTAVSGCSSADYTVGTPVITYGVIAPSGVVSGTVSVTMNNLSSNQDGCKLATVPLYFVAS